MYPYWETGKLLLLRHTVVTLVRNRLSKFHSWISFSWLSWVGVPIIMFQNIASYSYRCCKNFKSIILDLIIQNSSWYNPCEITPRWMPQNITNQISIGSGNGLVLPGNKPSFKICLTFCNWIIIFHLTHLTLLPQWTGSPLVQIMTCRLLGAKPLPEPMLTYSQLDP